MKPWAYVIAIVAIIGAIGGVYAKGDSNGYNRAKVEELEADKEWMEEEVARRTREWIETQDDAEEVIVYVDRVVTEIEYVDREITKEVEKIVELKPECRDLGLDDGFGGLLNKQIRAANLEPLSDADLAPIVVEPVPGTD